MNLTSRDRRALSYLALSLLLGLIWEFWPASSTQVVATASNSVDATEKRLAKLRETVATVPAKEDALRKVSAELAVREKGLIVADTGPQAQAQIIQLIRRVGNAEAPPVEIRGTEIGPIIPFGASYGEADVSVQIECRIDQLVNLLAALAAQPELVSTNDLRINAANQKEKTVNVRLTVAGIVPRKLVPVKKGAGA